MPDGRGDRIIFHVDLDAFYVAVERKEKPSLKGEPVVVGADPEGGRGRGVVITCSYEARKFGLRSGMPISKAYRLCPQAAFVLPDFSLYAKVSAKIMELLKKYADQVEQSGIDEAFLDVSSKVKDLDEAKELALKIKDELLSEGFTSSIGIGPNKSSSKIASDQNKPSGLTIVPEGKILEFLAPLPISVIPGVGPKTREFLENHGVSKIGELQEISGKQLTQWFGKGGVWLWGVAQGAEELGVIPRDMPRSLSVERTFRRDVKDFKFISKIADELGDELIRRVKLGELRFRTVGIRIRFRGFETHTREKTLVEYTDGLQELKTAVKSLLEEFSDTDRFVRLIGVRVSDLIREKIETSTLDTWSSG